MQIDPGRKTGGALLKGAAVLGAAAVISKLLGTIQKIPLQNLAGDTAYGIYTIVYPLYILILTLATAGFPLAVSKFVAERMAEGRPSEAKRVFYVAASVLSVLGVLGFLLLYLGADWLALWLGSSRTSLAIRSVSFALLLAPPMAALRGYFQGKQDMVPTAVSQVLEQLVRVAVMLGLLLFFMHAGYGDDWIAAGATFGSAAGAAAGLVVMLGWWKRESRALGGAEPRGKAAKRPEKQAQKAAAALPEQETGRQAEAVPRDDRGREPVRAIVSRFVRVALPICLGSAVLPILTLVDSFSMPRLLAGQGLDEARQLFEIGVYNHGQPLVQLTALIASSMSAALVPAIAEARLKRQDAALRMRTAFAVRFTWLVGLAASFGLAAASVPISIMFYKSAYGWETMAILAFTAVFSTVNIVTASLLVGFGAPVPPALHLLAAALLKTALNLALMPRWGIEGAAVSAVAAYFAASALNLRALRRRTGVQFPAVSYVWKPLLAIAALVTAVSALIGAAEGLWRALSLPPGGRGEAAAAALLAVAGGAAVYAAALFRFGVVTRGELDQAPAIGARLVPLLSKLRLLRD